MRDIKKIVVHHTGSRILGSIDSPRLVRMRHKYLKGFEDIGYHYLIGNGVLTNDGKVYKGRDLEREGAHAHGHNKDSIGIALIGNYDLVRPTEKQWDSLIKLLSEDCCMYNLTKNDIYGHNELDGADTLCPGRYILMDKVRREVLEKMLMNDIKFVRLMNGDFLK